MELEGIKKSVDEEIGERIGPNVLGAATSSTSGGGSTGSGSGSVSESVLLGPLGRSLSMGIGGQQCYSGSSTGSAGAGSGSGSGSVSCGSGSGSYHHGHHHPYSQQNCGRNNRRRSLPPSPLFSAEDGGFEHRSKIVSGNNSGSHPQQQQPSQQYIHQQHQNLKHSRKMRRYNKKLGKRLRRNTQNAPNNNNEFLMGEHDPLFHLDQDFEDDSNSDENHHQNGHDSTRTHRSIHLYSSSPEDDDDFLARDFSNAFENIHAERLFNMSKHQLIHEYQLMEERVELLENKLRSALLERRGLSNSAGGDGGILGNGGGGPLDLELGLISSNRPEALLFGNSPNHVKSEAIPVPISIHTNNTNSSKNNNILNSTLLSSSGASANEDDNDMSLSVSHLSSSQSSIPDDEEERFQYFRT